jgi:PAS domain S-box-containing protein
MGPISTDEHCYHIDLSLLKSSPVACYLTDEAGKILFINTAMESLFGYSAQECTGQAVRSCWSEIDGAGSVIEQTGLDSRQANVLIKTSSGETIPCQVTATSFHDLDNNTTIVLGMVTDLSHYMSTLDTLRSRNDRLGALASIAARISIYGDTHRLAREAMQAIADLLPIQGALFMLIDPATGQLVPHEGYNITRQEMNRYHADTSWEECLEGRVVREKGAILVEDVSADPTAVHYQEGTMSLGLIPLMSSDRTIGVLSVRSRAPHPLNQDDMEFLVTLGSQLGSALENTRLIGALKDSNALLQLQNQDLEELLSVISHDLRSPLATIGGYASLLMKKGGKLSPEERIDFAERIFRKTKETSRRFDDLLDIFRISFGQDEDEAVQLDPGLIMKQALVEAGFEEESLPVRVELPEDVPTLLGYPGHLMHIFTNLFSNSLKFMGEQKNPCISVQWEELETGGITALQFTVNDNGTGIHPDYIPTIFRPFTRGPEVEGIPGTGVGLASVHRIVRSHQGKLDIDSTVGEGTSIRFTLPWQKWD